MVAQLPQDTGGSGAGLLANMVVYVPYMLLLALDTTPRPQQHLNRPSHVAWCGSRGLYVS